ncbi:hypothetical protein Tco_0702479 [Tanacetum coccineum]|uniref:Uncharacterized protein n=1 Tax=Tanacetum coccineum TaxID=301880 RepID=A0ABQ4XXN7_9ASTR
MTTSKTTEFDLHKINFERNIPVTTLGLGEHSYPSACRLFPGIITFSGWPFVSVVVGQMTHLVASITLDSVKVLCDAESFLTQRKDSQIPTVLMVVGVDVTSDGKIRLPSSGPQFEDSTSLLKASLIQTQSSVQLLRENTDSVRSNQRIRPTVPFVRLKLIGDGVDTQSKVLDEQQQKVSGTNEGAGVTPEVPDVPKYDSESEEESWTFSQDDEDAEEESDKNDDSEETESDIDEDDLTHPNLSTYKVEDQEEEKAEEEEVYSDQRVSTPPDYELTKEEVYKNDDDKDKEGEQEEEEDDLYRDLNINLERSDAEMTDAQANQDMEDTHVTLTTVPPVSDTLVNVPVLVVVETPSSGTTIPQPPFPNIQPLQQTPTSTTTTNPTMNLPEIPNFASLFQFDQRVSALEFEMSEFRQTSKFAKGVSLIPGIVDTYLASKIKEAVDVATSYAVAASLSKFELKKILIDKIKTNKSIDISNTQKNLYNALVESYNTDKDIITSYGDVVTLKRGRDDQDMDEDPSAGSNRGSKRRRSGKEAYKSAHVEEHDQKAADLEDQPQQEFNTGNEDESPVREALNEDVWHRNPSRPPTPARGMHKQKSSDNLNLEERYVLNVALRMFTRCIYSRTCGRSTIGSQKIPKEDQPQKARHIPCKSQKMTPYTTYPDIQGIIYEDEMNRTRLMRTNELHKFSDGTLYHVRTALNDIVLGIKMEYLPKRK